MEDDCRKLDLLIGMEELRVALFQMKPWKAPTIVGFQAGFYQVCWEATKQALFDMVTAAFAQGNLPPDLNETLLALIPKVYSPEYVKQFRPISLCCVAYKLITKIIVNRIRPLLKYLVGPMQVSFVPGKQATDNIFLAQELIHTIKKTRSKNRLMAIKIDMEKAYDRVSWDLIIRFSSSILS